MKKVATLYRIADGWTVLIRDENPHKMDTIQEGEKFRAWLRNIDGRQYTQETFDTFEAAHAWASANAQEVRTGKSKKEKVGEPEGKKYNCPVENWDQGIVSYEDIPRFSEEEYRRHNILEQEREDIQRGRRQVRQK